MFFKIFGGYKLVLAIWPWYWPFIKVTIGERDTNFKRHANLPKHTVLGIKMNAMIRRAQCLVVVLDFMFTSSRVKVTVIELVKNTISHAVFVKCLNLSLKSGIEYRIETWWVWRFSYALLNYICNYQRSRSQLFNKLKIQYFCSFC